MTGKELKKLRTQLGLTQAEIAERTGFTIGTISNIENEYHIPNRSTLHAIFNAMNENEKEKK